MKTQFVLLSILLFSAFMVFSNTNVYADSHSVSVAGGGGSEGVSTPLSITLDGFSGTLIPDTSYSITNSDGTAAPDWITVVNGEVIVNPPLGTVPEGVPVKAFTFTLTATEGNFAPTSTFTYALIDTVDRSIENFVTNPTFFDTRHNVTIGIEQSFDINPHVGASAHTNSTSSLPSSFTAGVLSFNIPPGTPLGDNQVELQFCDSAVFNCTIPIVFKFRLISDVNDSVNISDSTLLESVTRTTDINAVNGFPNPSYALLLTADSSTAPNWITITGNTISFTPPVGTVPAGDLSKVFGITLTVDDGANSTFGTFTITVLSSTITPTVSVDNSGGFEGITGTIPIVLTGITDPVYTLHNTNTDGTFSPAPDWITVIADIISFNPPSDAVSIDAENGITQFNFTLVAIQKGIDTFRANSAFSLVVMDVSAPAQRGPYLDSIKSVIFNTNSTFSLTPVHITGPFSPTNSMIGNNPYPNNLTFESGILKVQNGRTVDFANVLPVDKTTLPIGTYDIHLTLRNANDLSLCSDNVVFRLAVLDASSGEGAISDPTAPHTTIGEGGCTSASGTSGGSSTDWKKKPTFGKSWEITSSQLVENGFTFNGYTLDITDNFHTDFVLTESIIGDTNHVDIKVYTDKILRDVTLSLGIPEIGDVSNAETDIIIPLQRDYENPNDYTILEIIHEQKESLVDEDATMSTISKVKCNNSSTDKRCYSIGIDFSISAPLKSNVLAISATDFDRRNTVTYINEGVEFTGESLLESATHDIHTKKGNQYPMETVTLTQQDRRYQVWEDNDGYLWTQNDLGSWLQITLPDFERYQDGSTSVMTSSHSGFNGMIQSEIEKAVLIFDSTEIQNEVGSSYAFVYPEVLDRSLDPVLLENMELQEILALEKSLNRFIYNDGW